MFLLTGEKNSPTVASPLAYSIGFVKYCAALDSFHKKNLWENVIHVEQSKINIYSPRISREFKPLNIVLRDLKKRCIKGSVVEITTHPRLFSMLSTLDSS